ncbi:MAG: metallophosphoesterase family protein, partial [Burkholderiales bacterium]
DVVVLAGDLLELSSIVDRRAQAIVVRKYFSRLRAVTRLVICSGNHDLDSPQESGEKVAKWLAASPDDGIITDGESLQLDGILITVCPWWDGPITRAGIAAQLGEAAKTERRLWIWIHHAPPDKSPISWGGSRSFGDVELRRWIEEHAPDIVLSGHVHQSPFVREGSWVDRIGPTWVFNAGQQFGAPPTHIIIDTQAGEALWFSSAGNQYIRFSEPLERPVPRLEAIPDWLKAEDRPQPPGRT